MRMRVGVIGGGSWGTTVAHITAHNVETTLWARRDDTADEINRSHRNSRYLDGYDLHPALRASADLGEVVRQADVLVMGVPSHAYRSTLEAVSDHLRAWVPIVSLTKGLEQGSRLRMSEVTNEVLPGHPASVVATSDPVVALRLQQLFATSMFRVYTNHDVVGCELGGALKNVIAIASGMADGLGTGDNTRAAVITRGLAELSRLGRAMGGEEITFAGLAGMGDLIATCISPHSRNRHVGEQLGRGRSIDEVIASMNMVAEGVKTAPVVLDLAAEYGVETPIADEVNGVCHLGRAADVAYRGLLRHQTGPEREPIDPA